MNFVKNLPTPQFYRRVLHVERNGGICLTSHTTCSTTGTWNIYTRSVYLLKFFFWYHLYKVLCQLFARDIIKWIWIHIPVYESHMFERMITYNLTGLLDYLLSSLASFLSCGWLGAAIPKIPQSQESIQTPVPSLALKQEDYMGKKSCQLKPLPPLLSSSPSIWLCASCSQQNSVVLAHCVVCSAPQSASTSIAHTLVSKTVIGLYRTDWNARVGVESLILVIISFWVSVLLACLTYYLGSK